eukprot:6492255-Amphidinium_carterae.2
MLEMTGFFQWLKEHWVIALLGVSNGFMYRAGLQTLMCLSVLAQELLNSGENDKTRPRKSTLIAYMSLLKDLVAMVLAVASIQEIEQGNISRER